ncbi:hypothetical protein [Nonomuraea sp. NPDC050691]|uniref:hypothetical protein n=1 Tax=Nonomuraea sp. NPDC050691 TaxID=3155661 RepID=UPI0033D79DD3
MISRTAEHRDRVIQGALEAARWAPSVHNTQPWSFAISGEEISLRADVDRKLRLGDPSDRELLISCGAALFTIRTALRCEGVEPVVRVLPDPDRPSLVATITLGEAAEADERVRAMGRQIERRRTHRAGFTDLPVPERLMDGLVREARDEGARLTPVRSPVAVAMLAALTQAAQGAQSQDRVLTLELIRWARPPGSSRRDGVPAEGYPRTAPPTDPGFPQRDYAWRHEAFHTQALETYHLGHHVRRQGERPQVAARAAPVRAGPRRAGVRNWSYDARGAPPVDAEHAPGRAAGGAPGSSRRGPGHPRPRSRPAGGRRLRRQ